MNLSRAFGVAASDLYHQSWRLIVLNLALGAVVLGVVLASLAVRAAIVLAVLVGPAAASVMHCAVTLAQTEDLRLSEALVGVRRHWRRGLALGVLLAGAAAAALIAIPFYVHAGRWAWPLAALSIYLLLMFGMLQLALWPLAVFEAGKSFGEVVKDASIDVLRKPFGFLLLGLGLLLVNAIGLAAAIIPFLTLTIAYSFLVSAHFALPKNPAREA